MKHLFLMLSILGVLINSSASADQSSLNPQTENGVSFVSGGVGEDERNELQALRADYNLSLMFSVKGTGDYLSDVKVRIVDTSGAILLETVPDGPILYVKLKPGHYNVFASQNGFEMSKKTSIGPSKMTTLSFVWSKE